MSGWAVARCAGAAVLLVAIGPSAMHANDAAGTVAERFASDADLAEVRRQRAQAQGSESARRIADERSAEEADMLARARREAEEMKAADERARLVEEARRLVIEAEKVRANAGALIEQQGKQAAETSTRMVPSASTDVPLRETGAAATPRAGMAAGESEEARAAEEERLAQLRREETRRLIEKLDRVRRIREARIAAQERQVPSEQTRREGSPRAPWADSARSQLQETESADRGDTGPPDARGDDWRADRVTVLLILTPGTYGIRRRGPKVADPILCTPVGCYVSEGAGRPARFMPGRKALGFGNTWGLRAGACRQRLGCVFRDVEFGRWPAYLQPVDLHILRHDRRRPHEVAGDSACRSSGGRLVCGRGIYAEDYAMWIVPERVAEEVGPDALDRAVADGLDGPRSADIFTLLGR